MNGKKLLFMLDSGASSNFVAKHVVDRLDLDLKKGKQLKVKLADSRIMNTIGYVETMVALGPM